MLTTLPARLGNIASKPELCEADRKQVQSLKHTIAGKLMAPIRNRQPSILAPDEYDDWLNDASKAPALLEQLKAEPGPYGEMEAVEVGTLPEPPAGRLALVREGVKRLV